MGQAVERIIALSAGIVKDIRDEQAAVKRKAHGVAKRVAQVRTGISGSFWRSPPRRPPAPWHGCLCVSIVVEVNVGGSREALFLAMEIDIDIFLVQEHRIAGPGLPGVQATALGKGGDGVWYPVAAHGSGRSGGTAVLTRRPAQIVLVGPEPGDRSR